MYKDILIPVDLDDEHSWEKALPMAVRMAEAFGARLHVMTVVPDFGMPMVSQYFPPDYEQKMRDEASKRLHAFVAKHVPSTLATQHIVAEGRIYQQIVEAQQRTSADLIVMGSHTPELRDYLIGPNALKVVQHAACSVLVVRG
jgi:nucleotide-binding universal stress UspA family protein